VKFRKSIAVDDGKSAGVPGHFEGKGLGGKSGALRAAIFGANDGLVSNLALIMGVAGATDRHQTVLLAGIAGLLAGAFSMGAGEFISMRVQRDVFENLLEYERKEQEDSPDEELAELIAIYETKGIPEELARATAEAVHANPDLRLDTHAREELGLDPADLGSPWGAAISSFITFSIGALIPLMPFLFLDGTMAIVVASVLSLATLFAIGGAMTMLTGKHFYVQGLKMMAIGGSAALVTWLVGNLLGVNLG
jgi:vacuolar iron transporter family protein